MYIHIYTHIYICIHTSYVGKTSTLALTFLMDLFSYDQSSCFPSWLIQGLARWVFCKLSTDSPGQVDFIYSPVSSNMVCWKTDHLSGIFLSEPPFRSGIFQPTIFDYQRAKKKLKIWEPPDWPNSQCRTNDLIHGFIASSDSEDDSCRTDVPIAISLRWFNHPKLLFLAPPKVEKNVLTSHICCTVQHYKVQAPVKH